MTLTGEYAPSETQTGGATYPSAFGITFTPTTFGILAAIGGLAIAAYLGTQFVVPAYGRFQELKQNVADKEATLEQQTEIVKQVNQIIARVNQAKVRNQEVRGLFSSQESLETLLLDLNRLIVEQKAELVKFQPELGASGPVNDGSLGLDLNGKLKRQVTTVSFQGTFAQTLEIMRLIDRLQTLLEVKGLTATLQTDLTNREEPRMLVASNFRLIAYVPLTSAEIAAAAQAAAEAEAKAKEKNKKK